MPCAIAQAFDSADAAHPHVKLAAGTYIANIKVAGKSVTAHGTGATVNATAGARTFEVNDGGALRLIGLSVANSNTGSFQGTALACETVSSAAVPSLELDNVSVNSASSYALFGYPCTVTVRNSRITAQDPNQFVMVIVGTTAALIDRSIIDGGNAILSEGDGSVVRITNSIIRNQGPDGAFIGSRLFSTVPGSMFVSFSTIVNSLVKCPNGVPKCAGGNDAGSCVDNSIILNVGGPADTVQGSACRVSHSIVFPQATTPSGSNNQLVSPLLKSPSTGDYHLLQGSPAIDRADPAATNAIDFDGVLRPQGAGKDIGAFEYKP